MNRAFIGALFFILLFAYGCGTTIKELKEGDNKKVFIANEKYESVYRKILDKSRECFHGGFFGENILVQGDIYKEIKYANVNVVVTGKPVRSVMAIEIYSINDNTSKVETYYDNPSDVPIVEAIEKWIKEDYKECVAYPKEEPIDEQTKGR